MKPMHISDPEVCEAVEEAARAACHILDETFPGKDSKDSPGITSNFQGLLEEVLRQMIAGVDPLAAMKGYQTGLPALAYTDARFGNQRQIGDGYVVLKPSPEQPSWRHPDDMIPDLALNDLGTRFVPLGTPDAIDPFTSYEAAVQGAMSYLKEHDEETGQQIEVRAVAMAPNGWTLMPR